MKNIISVFLFSLFGLFGDLAAASSGQQFKSCDQVMAKYKSLSASAFMVFHAPEVLKLCPIAVKEQFRATLNSDEIRSISDQYMKKCIQKLDPHQCMPKVNTQMEAVKKLNGGVFGQNDADLRDLRERRKKEEANHYREVSESEKAQMYCCAIGSHIIYGPDRNGLEEICEKVGKCGGSFTVNPFKGIPASIGGSGAN